MAAATASTSRVTIGRFADQPLPQPHRRQLEAVAASAQRGDHDLVGGLEPCAEPGHVDLDGVAADVDLALPHHVEQPLPRDHPTRVAHQLAQHRELAAGDLGLEATDPDPLFQGIEDHVADGDPVLGRLPTSAERLEAGGELLHGERLDQVVVGPRLEAGHPLGDRAAGGQHQDRQVDPLAAQPSADVEPAIPGSIRSSTITSASSRRPASSASRPLWQPVVVKPSSWR